MKKNMYFVSILFTFLLISSCSKKPPTTPIFFTNQYITQWGTSGHAEGHFLQPQGLAIDKDDNIYVADTYNNRIQKFNNSGTYITQWGSFGSGNGQFELPYDIAVDTNENVYVVDNVNNRIQKFSN